MSSIGWFSLLSSVLVCIFLEESFGSLKGMGARWEIWWCSRVCTVCTSLLADATSSKAANLAAYFSAFITPVHALHYRYPCTQTTHSHCPLAPCRSCCLRPTGCAAHYLRTFLKSFLRSACSILQIEWTSVLCTGVTTQIEAAAIFPVANSNISRDNFSHSIFIK